MTRTVWTFPGQLTEYVGMPQSDWLRGSRRLEESLTLASEALGRDVTKICREGPEVELRRDDCAAAAVVAVGVSAAGDLLEEGLRPDAVLGYSLGLYSAAVVAGALPLEAALRLVIAIAREGDRVFAGETMIMGFVTGLKLKTLESAIGDLLDAGDVAVTNVNSQAQIIVAGRGSAVEAALTRVRPQAIRCERLPISRPYHSRWMAPVARSVQQICASIDVRAPRLPLLDHRDGAPLTTAEVVRERLGSQLTSRLDWSASIVRVVAEGATLVLEMPPGATTTRMTRWIARDTTCLALDLPGDRERLFEAAWPGGRAVAP